MERDEDEDEGAGPTVLELAEMMQHDSIRKGSNLHELLVTQRAYDQLEQECWPCTVEEYFDIPIYILGRH